MTYFGTKGVGYKLDTVPFAKGGEGAIYNVLNMPGMVAKIYHGFGDGTNEKLADASVDNREEKLLAMLENPPDKSQLEQIAWPKDVLFSAKGKFVGFIMQKLETSDELNIMYEYGMTAKYPTLVWKNKITIAKNLCVVVSSIHKANHVIGDFNPKNISVNAKTGKITMLDTDSYHITEKESIFRCTVGMPEYLPAELQKKMKGVGLAEAKLPTFTKESDNFALAVHIFQLLMNGVHPFAIALKPGAKSVSIAMPSDNIIKCKTAFFSKIRNRTIPSFAPNIKILPRNILALFKRAFLEGHIDPKARPCAEEWFKALSKLEKTVKNCRRISFHQHRKGFRKCPWCEADKRFRETRRNATKKSREKAEQKARVEKVKKQRKREKEIDALYQRVYGEKRPKKNRDLIDAVWYIVGIFALVGAIMILIFLIL